MRFYSISSLKSYFTLAHTMTRSCVSVKFARNKTVIKTSRVPFKMPDGKFQLQCRALRGLLGEPIETAPPALTGLPCAIYCN